MVKKKEQKETMVTREILTEELSKIEKRFDSKVDITAVSFKEYTDSRFNRLEIKFEEVASRFEEIDSRFEKIDLRFDKMDRYFEQLVGMFVAQGKKLDNALLRIDNHEGRLTVLETKH